MYISHSRLKDIEEIKILVEKALTQLYYEDHYLINNRPPKGKREYHVSERGIVFRFGIHLEKLLLSSPFKHLNLDTEYNRNIQDLKRTPKHRNGTYPDLIIHKRGDNNHNLLILEFKTWWNPNNIKDIEKINEFRDPQGFYHYAIGGSIILEEDKPIIHWI